MSEFFNLCNTYPHMTCCVVLLYFIYTVCYYIRIHVDMKENINLLSSYFSNVLTINF